jgi:N-acetylglucosamine-6-phosphate deacetylase
MSTAAEASFSPVDLQVNGGWGVDFSDPDVTVSELRDCCARPCSRPGRRRFSRRW